jgi:hypothetical protein
MMSPHGDFVVKGKSDSIILTLRNNYRKLKDNWSADQMLADIEGMKTLAQGIVRQFCRWLAYLNSRTQGLGSGQVIIKH